MFHFIPKCTEFKVLLISMYYLQSDVPIDLLDVEKNSAVVSYSSCQPEVHHLYLNFMQHENVVKQFTFNKYNVNHLPTKLLDFPDWEEIHCVRLYQQCVTFSFIVYVRLS